LIRSGRDWAVYSLASLRSREKITWLFRTDFGSLRA
jgi:hypothetical protein